MVVTLVQDLYRAQSTCADHHDGDTIRRLHVSTAVDVFLVQEARPGRVIFVSGNPGDGKTHLLRYLESQLVAKGVELCLDANEQSDDSLVQRIDAAIDPAHNGLVLAVNQGILVDLCRRQGEKTWASAVRKQLLHPFHYSGVHPSEGGGVPERPSISHEVLVVDLSHRNNLSGAVVRQALERLAAGLTPCDGCPTATCPVSLNPLRLNQDAVAGRLVELLERCGEFGYHATMRDLQAFLSYLIFAGDHCELIKQEGSQAKAYWRNAFEGGVGGLFDTVRQMDPARIPAPILDDLLWRSADTPGQWLPGFTDVGPADDGIDGRMKRFVDRKRRAFFEHVDGPRLLESAGSNADKLFADIVSGQRSDPSVLVRLLNRFFDRDEENGALLYLWTSHRYDAASSRFAAAYLTVPASELQVLYPHLDGAISPAFPNLRMDHVLLRHRRMADDEGLRVDRGFIEALVAAAEGAPASFRRGEPAARIAAFFDRLSRLAGEAEGKDQYEVRFVDVDTGANLVLRVDSRRRRYVGQ